MKQSIFSWKFILVFIFSFVALAQGAQKYPNISTIEQYNAALPYWGFTWQPDSASENGYHPSFYTGFAMRSQFPNRIHIRQARGNQTRMSIVLDETTILDYLFDLVKRDEFYKKVLASGKISLLPDPKAVPHQRMFSEIVNSPVYGIRDLVTKVKKGEITNSTQIYSKALSVLETLNPGRVFRLNINLGQEFLKWKNLVLNSSNNSPASFISNEKNLLLVLNTLLPGRINYTQNPSKEVRAKVLETLNVAMSANDDAFVASALELFKLVTGSKYQILTLQNGALVPAIRCESAASCTLNYPEFTTIYPTGSLLGHTSDDKGNTINRLASPGLWTFVDYGKPVDRIPAEPYYGWAPKLFYEKKGNAFHNPGLKFSSIKSSIKESLGIPSNHSIMWSVKRGAVSHGCSRLGTGHIWEMRHILPVESEKIFQTHVFIHLSQDLDVYDIDGNGQAEVMGVEYLISYGLKDNNYENREADGLDSIDPAKKLAFYTDLYGSRGVFTVNNNGKIVFLNPTISMPNYLDYNKKTVSNRLTLNGQYALYEQTYEKDKIQLYRPRPSNDLIRLMGRVRGCAPTTNKTECGEEAFDKEATKLLK